SALPIAEENNEKVANANKGKVVRNPAQELERFNSSLISGINGPTEVIVGLRQKETRTIAKNNNQLVGTLLVLVFISSNLAIDHILILIKIKLGVLSPPYAPAFKRPWLIDSARAIYSLARLAR